VFCIDKPRNKEACICTEHMLHATASRGASASRKERSKRNAGSLVEEDGQGFQQQASAVTFQRLLFEVFSKDTNKLREYCLVNDVWVDAVSFLDAVDGGGWDLLDALLQGETECCDLLDVPFLSTTAM
jgi:hypothetical protein